MSSNLLLHVSKSQLVAPPPISDARLLDEIVDRLGEVLVEAGDHMSAGVAAIA